MAFIAFLVFLVCPNQVDSIVTHAEAAEVTHETPQWTFETLLPYLAKKHGQNEALAREIIRCESRNKAAAKNDNYTKSGVYWSSDHGYWQINDYYNADSALRRGYDVVNVWEENLEFGFIMLKEQGTRPWLASKSCWGIIEES